MQPTSAGSGEWDRGVTGTEPITDSHSKRVMLRAERHDSIVVDHVLHQVDSNFDVPGPLEVIRRSTTYFGPELKLMDSSGSNYKLTAPGPDRNLLMWKADTDDDGYCNAWRVVAEVTCDFGKNLDQYETCPDCGQPIKSAEHERVALIGECSGNYD